VRLGVTAVGAVLVTGAAGFVGSPVATAFLDAGYQVVGVDAIRPTCATEIKRDNLRVLGEHPRFTFHERDLVHGSLDDLVADVEVISHQAGRAGLRDSWGSDFGEYLADNVAVTQRLLEAVSGAHRVRRVILASSSSTYGDAAAFPTLEETRPAPLSPYGVSKLAGEHLGTAYALANGAPVVSLRYFSVFGPAQRPDMAFSRMIDAALGSEPFPLLGTGEQVRDYTYVGDIAAANLACAEADLSPGMVLNIAGGVQASVLGALQVVTEITGAPVPVKHRPPASGEARRTAGDTSAARDVLGWQPEGDLRTGLAAQYRARVAQLDRLGGRTLG
jgi:nucleoside-diphosphate-sugar epimerase